jgi:hypothetical protein
VVLGQIDKRFAFPGLASRDPVRRADGAGHDCHERDETGWRFDRGPGESLEGEDDERVPGKHRERLAEGPVDGGSTPPHIRVVEAGQVVVDEGRAMEQFDRRRGPVHERRRTASAGRRDRQREAWTKTRPAREHGVPERGRKSGGRAGLG